MGPRLEGEGEFTGKGWEGRGLPAGGQGRGTALDLGRGWEAWLWELWHLCAVAGASQGRTSGAGATVGFRQRGDKTILRVKGEEGMG